MSKYVKLKEDQIHVAFEYEKEWLWYMGDFIITKTYIKTVMDRYKNTK